MLHRQRRAWISTISYEEEVLRAWPDLSKLSVGELAELIEGLKEEIARVEATRSAKESSRSAADAAFKR